MKKIILFGKENLTLELTAIFLFILVLVSNLIVIGFAEGYFRYYNIPLADVNFIPQMYDYKRIALPVLIAASIMTLIAFISMRVGASAGDFLASKTNPSEQFSKYIKHHERFFIRLVKILNLVFIAILAITVLWIFGSASTSFATKLGRYSAESAKQLDSISSPNDKLQEVIVYKGNDEIITKAYDTSKKEFLDGYRVLIGTSYSVRTFDR